MAGGSGKAGAVYEEVNAKEEATETSIGCPGPPPVAFTTWQTCRGWACVSGGHHCDVA